MVIVRIKYVDPSIIEKKIQVSENLYGVVGIVCLHLNDMTRTHETRSVLTIV